LRVDGNYSTFLQKKEDFLAAQAKQQDALANRVRTEIEWLRRGPKARATKAKARIDKAHELIGELAEVSARNRTAVTSIEFSATDRQTKRLIELENLTYGFGNRTLFAGLNFGVLRSEPDPQPRGHAASRFGSRQRFRYLPGSRDPCCILGVAVPVQRRSA
jgi:ATP-binding cassette subfamily F protein uup